MTRVSWYIVLPCCILAVGLTYWLGTRSYDFVTPPEGMKPVTEADVAAFTDESTEPELEETQASQVSDSNTLGEQQLEVVVEKEPELFTEPLPDSQWDDYLDHSDKGTNHYVALAKALREKEHLAHSLVAWERVLDSVEATGEQLAEAYVEVKKLKPVKPDNLGRIAISVQLHASVPGDMYEKVEKQLQASAALIEEASGFSLKVTPEVSVMAVRKGKPRPAVSIWFAGKNESARGNFRTKSANELGLSEKIDNTIFNVVDSFLSEHAKLKVVQKKPEGVNAQQALKYLISRHSWREMGRLLYTKLEPAE